MIDFARIIEIIEKNNSFLITSHINPDGDAIGSELALHKFLIDKGKSSEIINHSKTPANMKFIDVDNNVKVLGTDIQTLDTGKYDVIFVIDLNQLSRTGDLGEPIRNSGKLLVCIDHHQNPEEFTKNLFVDDSYGSTGEMIYDLIVSEGDKNLNYDIALAIYVAILTDTGSFKYERTRPATHHKAARLLEFGIDPKWTHSQIYHQGSLNIVKLLARALNSLEVYNSGKVALMKIYQNDLSETGTTESDMESFVNYTLSIRDVKIGIFMYELENGVKISFRSVGSIPVNNLAAEFGGGGHVNAAATRLTNESIENAISLILNAVGKYFNESEG